MIKWNYRVDFPPLVSPLVTQGLVFSGYIPFTETASTSKITSNKDRSGVGTRWRYGKEDVDGRCERAYWGRRSVCGRWNAVRSDWQGTIIQGCWRVNSSIWITVSATDLTFVAVKQSKS